MATDPAHAAPDLSALDPAKLLEDLGAAHLELEGMREQIEILRASCAEKTHLWMQAGARCATLVQQANKVGHVLVAIRELLAIKSNEDIVEGARAVAAELERLRKLTALVAADPAAS